MKRFNRGRTLEALEGRKWGAPNYPSHVVVRCHELRKIPVCDLKVEDLRLLIGQKMGLPFLLPIALEILEKEPLAEGDFHPGDLLRAVLRVPDDAWDDESRRRLQAIVARVPQP